MTPLSARGRRLDIRAQPRIHSDAEVERAVAGLTPADLKRLRAVARAILSRDGLSGADRGPDDLVSEAVTRTLNRSRGWRLQLDFLRHLAQSMRSIAWTWKERFDVATRAGLPVSLENVPLPTTIDESLLSHEPNPRAAAIARDLVRKIAAQFADDHVASAVLAGWAVGDKGPEIRRRHELTENQLRAAVRRIRRFALRLRDGEPGDRHGC